MYTTISSHKIMEAAHAFGLKGDTLGRTMTQDRFGRLVDATPTAVGFISKIVRAPCTTLSAKAFALELSYVNLGESAIVDHDATSEIVVDPNDWQKLAPTSKLLGVAGHYVSCLADPKLHEYQNFFFTKDATFVAIELCGIPERLMLYTAELHFDIDYVIARLRKYRAEHPLPTVSEMAGAYTIM